MDQPSFSCKSKFPSAFGRKCAGSFRFINSAILMRSIMFNQHVFEPQFMFVMYYPTNIPCDLGTLGNKPIL